MKKEEYKKFPFPVGPLINYIISMVIEVGLFYFYFTLTIPSQGYNFGHLIIFCIPVLIVGTIVRWIVGELFCEKTYRVGWINDAIVITILISLALFIVYHCIFNSDWLFYKTFCIILILCQPILTLQYVDEHKTSCKNCKLTNVCEVCDTTKEDLGDKEYYHTEYGTTQQVRKTFTVNGECVTIESWENTPDKKVYDGTYNKTRITDTYKCKYCGQIHKNSYTKETRID